MSTVTARLSGATSATVTLNVSAAPLSGAVASDFRLSGNTTLTITAGQTESTGAVTVAAEDNAVDAPDKTVQVSAGVTAGPAGMTAPAARTLTITDDEGTPAVTLELFSTSISENGGVSTVTARLSGATSETVTLNVSAAPLSGAVANDFRLSGNTTLSITSGQTQSTGTVTVTAVNNTMDAPHKTVRVTASVTAGPTGVAPPAAEILTITDDETAPTVTLALAPDSISENGGVSTVTARLSGTTSETVTVTVMAPEGSNDFDLSANNALTISSGSMNSTGTVTITARNDEVDGPNKEITVTGMVTAPVGMTAPAAQILTIVDDDPTPTVTLELSPDSISEKNGASGLTARLSGATSQDVKLTVIAEAVSPAVANDFRLDGTTLTITAGQTRSGGTVTVTANDNTVNAPDKTVELSATVTAGPTGMTAPATQTLTITDDEGTPTVTLVLSQDEISENGGVSTVTASLSGATSQDVTLRVAARAVQPAVAADFALSSNTTLTITAGQIESTGIVTVDAEDNTVDAPDKTVDVSATVTAGPTGMPAPATQTLTITDDEGTPTVTLVLSPDQISEDDGVSTVTARLNRATSEAVTVKVMAAGEAGAFELSTDTDLTIAANSTESTGTVTVAALDNEIDGPNKQVTVTGMVTGPEGMTAPAAETLTIVDDEGAPTVTLLLSPDAISENRGVSTVKASLSGATSAEVTVQVSAEAVSPAGQADFTLSTNRTLTIKDGDTASTGTVTVTGVDDTVGGPSKQVTVSGTVTGPDGVTPPAPKTLTIEDDEAPAAVSLEIDPAEVGEGDGETDVTVTATLVGAIQSVATTVTVSVDSGTAIEGADFQTVQDFTLTIEENDTTADDIFTLILVDDTELEESETVEVRASAGAVTVTQFITIADNDSQSMQQKVKLSMEGDSEWVMEDAGPTPVTVKAELTGEPRDVETRVNVELHPHEASRDDFEAAEENFEILIQGEQDERDSHLHLHADGRRRGGNRREPAVHRGDRGARPAGRPDDADDQGQRRRRRWRRRQDERAAGLHREPLHVRPAGAPGRARDAVSDRGRGGARPGRRTGALCALVRRREPLRARLVERCAHLRGSG